MIVSVGDFTPKIVLFFLSMLAKWIDWIFGVFCSDILKSSVMTFIASHFNTGITRKCVSTYTVYKLNKQYVICFKNTAILKIIECD